MDGTGIRTVVGQMLTVEGQARDIVAQAERQSKDAVARARDEAQRLLTENRKTATAQADAAAKTAMAQAQKEHDARIVQLMEADARVIAASRNRTADAAAVIVRRVAGA